MIYRCKDKNEHNFSIRLTATPAPYHWTVKINVTECGGECIGRASTLAGAISDALHQYADKIAVETARSIIHVAELADGF